MIELPGRLIEKDTKTHANRRISLDPDTIAVFTNQRKAALSRAQTRQTWKSAARREVRKRRREKDSSEKLRTPGSDD